MNDLFSKEQMAFLEKRYGLAVIVEDKKAYPCRDGVVFYGDNVWWRAEGGPELVLLVESKDNTHITNIQRYPDYYQISKPVIEYVD